VTKKLSDHLDEEF
jgi:hypothetical protein